MTETQPCACAECDPKERWGCGGAACTAVIEGGDAEKLEHVRTEHPAVFAMLWFRIGSPSVLHQQNRVSEQESNA